MSVDSILSADVLDVEGSLDRFGGDKDLFVEMTALLLEDAPPLFNALQAAVASEDAITVEQRAHALKGLLVNCGGVRAANAAQRLEDAGRARNVQHATTLVSSLKTELGLLTQAIHAYRP